MLQNDEATPPDPLAPQIVAAAGQVMGAALQAGRDPRCIRFDWRGGMRLRPVAPPGGAIAEALLRLSPAALSRPPAPWDEARVTAYLLGWVGLHFQYGLRSQQEAEAWVELCLPPALEEPLVAELDDDGARRLVADALLEQGYPRGTLMALQLAGSDAAATRNHLRRYPWLLPIAGHSMRLVLDGGFVSRLEVEGAYVSAIPSLKLLLRHPALRFLHSIQLDMPAGELPPFLRAIEEVGHRSVRELRLPRVKSRERYRSRMKRALPRLVSLPASW